MQGSSEDPNCEKFNYVTLRVPHGDPVHMHLRYGDVASGFQILLKESTVAEEAEKFNPWWSVYCAEGVSRCDE